MSSGRVIDLQGPQGNAFALIATAEDLLSQLNQTHLFEMMRTEMMSGDYDKLIGIFEKNFGDYVELVNKPGEEFEDDRIDTD